MLITGLPAAGKTTLGTALAAHIENHFGRKVTLLDGDEARKLLSSELGYSRGHRRLNVLRHGFVAAEVCRHGGIAISSLIAPYEADRAEARRLACATAVLSRFTCQRRLRYASSATRRAFMRAHAPDCSSI